MFAANILKICYADIVLVKLKNNVLKVVLLSTIYKNKHGIVMSEKTLHEGTINIVKMHLRKTQCVFYKALTIRDVKVV